MSMDQLSYQMGKEKTVATPELKEVLSKLDKLVKEQQGKLPVFTDEDKKNLTQEVVRKIKLG